MVDFPSPCFFPHIFVWGSCFWLCTPACLLPPRPPPASHTTYSHTTTCPLTHTQLVLTQLAHTQLTHTQLTHTQLVHTHTQLCHTQLFHTQLYATLPQRFFYTQLCHTQSFAHNFDTHTQSFTRSFVTNNFVIHNSFTHTQLCHRQCFAHNSFTHNLSHTQLFHSQPFTHNSFTHNSFTHNFVTHTHNSSHTTLKMIDPPPSPLPCSVPFQPLFLSIGWSWLVGLSGPLTFSGRSIFVCVPPDHIMFLTIPPTNIDLGVGRLLMGGVKTSLGLGLSKNWAT